MFTRIFVAIAGLALLTATASAGNRIDDNRTILFDNGHWRTEKYAQNTKGVPMCAMVVNRQFADRATGNVSVKANAADHLFIHLYKSNWRMTPGLQVPMYVSFDGDRREAMGNIIRGSTGSTIVEITVNQNLVSSILENFAKADQLTIEFKEGNERPWVDRLIDSRRATESFNLCLEKIGPTQPVARGDDKPTQPVAPTQPTQPAAPGNKKLKPDNAI
jgi:hypothetical protein